MEKLSDEAIRKMFRTMHHHDSGTRKLANAKRKSPYK